MLTLVSGMPISKGKVNRSQDLCLIAKETTGDYEHGFVFKHVYTLVLFLLNPEHLSKFRDFLIRNCSYLAISANRKYSSLLLGFTIFVFVYFRSSIVVGFLQSQISHVKFGLFFSSNIFVTEIGSKFWKLSQELNYFRQEKDGMWYTVKLYTDYNLEPKHSNVHSSTHHSFKSSSICNRCSSTSVLDFSLKLDFNWGLQF